MKFGYTILYVQNVRHTLGFYASAFGFSTRFVLLTNEYDLQSSTTLAFASEEFVDKSIGADEVRVTRNDDTATAGAEISFGIDKGEGIDDVSSKQLRQDQW